MTDVSTIDEFFESHPLKEHYFRFAADDRRGRVPWLNAMSAPPPDCWRSRLTGKKCFCRQLPNSAYICC